MARDNGVVGPLIPAIVTALVRRCSPARPVSKRAPVSSPSPLRGILAATFDPTGVPESRHGDFDCVRVDHPAGAAAIEAGGKISRVRGLVIGARTPWPGISGGQKIFALETFADCCGCA